MIHILIAKSSNAARRCFSCESGLMCVDRDNRAMPVVKWYHYGRFTGKCQKIEMCHVIGDGRLQLRGARYRLEDEVAI